MDLIYQVREKGNPAMRRFTRSAIAKEAAEGRLAADALVTTEHVDEWYTVAELLGDAPAPQFPFLCPHCRVGIQGRWVDIGGMMTCPECRSETAVPNIRRAVQKRAVTDAMEELRKEERKGWWLLAGGIAVTVLGFVVSVYEGWNAYAAFIAPVLAGAAMVHGSVTCREVLKIRLENLRHPDRPPTLESSISSWRPMVGFIVTAAALFWALTHLGLLPVHEVLPHRQ